MHSIRIGWIGGFDLLETALEVPLFWPVEPLEAKAKFAPREKEFACGDWSATCCPLAISANSRRVMS